ncbi:hypothetical protein EVAR_60556_1 [Eumeta japonica]|uniref:Uncharacterized protein n=1 Tax=Eumeta variegata TaxID=151549 RepID=A0A4C1YE68_EUMVA|nr:hypothetical protein EVAR_60556_1 [Eumeta japonica]
MDQGRRLRQSNNSNLTTNKMNLQRKRIHKRSLGTEPRPRPMLQDRKERDPDQRNDVVDDNSISPLDYTDESAGHFILYMYQNDTTRHSLSNCRRGAASGGPTTR